MALFKGNCNNVVLINILLIYVYRNNTVINITILSTGNKLTCDCRLAWLQKLHNETRSKRLKLALSRLNCIMDTKLKTNLATKPKTNLIPLKKDPDYEDEDEEDKQYDEMQDQENNEESKIEYRRKLVDIPSEILPCPNRLIYEASFSPPTQDEVKYYKSSAKSITANICYFLLVFITL